MSLGHDTAMVRSVGVALGAVIGAAACGGSSATDAATTDGTAGEAQGDTRRDGGPGDGTDGPAPDSPAETKKTYDCGRPHPAWLACDDFEGMSAGFGAWFKASPWTDAIGQGDPGRMTSSTEAHAGKFALSMPAAEGSGYQGADLIWRACPPGSNKPGCKPVGGSKQLYLRAFVKFAPDHERVHHFLSVGGGPTDDYWAPFGNAGCRPNGKRWMGADVDFKALSHETFFYVYYPEMKCDPEASCAKYADPKAICAQCSMKDMPCASGPECCWGANIAPMPPVPLPVGKWFCFEMAMKPNDVGMKNGEARYWVDGKLGHEITGMHWRDVDSLQMNMVRLQHYIETSDAMGKSNRVWFDDVVISTEPVGCE